MWRCFLIEFEVSGKYLAIAKVEIVASGDSLTEAYLAPRGNVSHRLVFKVGERLPRRVRLGWRVSKEKTGLTSV